MTSEEAAQRADDEEELALLEARDGGEGLLDYIGRVSPHLPPPRHLVPIAAEFERARRERIRLCISMPPGSAKLVADSTPILTPTGWTTHGALRVGDQVYAPDGTATSILHVTPKGLATLAVTFSDGESIRVNPGHRWRVFVKSRNRWEVLETGQMLALGVAMPATRGGKARARFLVEQHRAVAGGRRDLPIDPYVFGLWLGDGSTGNGRITGTRADAEHHMAEARARGYEIGAIHAHPTTGCLTFCVLGMKIRSQVGHGKFIPWAYFVADEEQRRELLRGLVDSDGHVDADGGCHFTNGNRRLIDEVARLVSSLGYVVTISAHAASSRAFGGYTSRTKGYWKVDWTPTDGAQQARLPRKDVRHKAVDRRRSIVSIEPCEPEEGHCIAVEHQSHQYLIGDRCVPTHNTTLIQHGLAWWLSETPADACSYSTYADKLAKSKARRIRQLASAGGLKFARDANNLSEWRTQYGGGLISGGIGSGLTGQRVTGLAIVDDPIKDRKEADSESRRNDVDDWFREVVTTRLEAASVIVVATRWHPDDLIGRLAKRGLFKIINIPAIAGADDLLGRAPGEALWPTIHDIGYLRGIQEQLGDFSFAALYQGQPRPRGGTLFHEPHYYTPAETSFEGCRYVLAADPAASTKTSADYSAVVVLSIKGIGEEQVAYVRHVYRKRVEIPDFVNDLLKLQHQWGDTLINVESVGGFKAVPQMLKAIKPDIRLNEINPEGDKFQRAQRVSAAWNAGRVLVPDDSPSWLMAFLDECANFTGTSGDAHDDQVDALSHAWNSSKPSMFDLY